MAESFASAAAGERVAIVAGLRTPFARQLSDYKAANAIQLGVLATSELLTRTDLDPVLIERVVYGQVITLPEAPNIAREVVLNAGMNVKTDAFSVSRACATSFQSAMDIAQAIRLGDISIGLAGGADSTSVLPIQVSRKLADTLTAASRAKSLGARLSLFKKLRPKDLAPVAPAIKDYTTQLGMGEIAEQMAKKHRISRESQDELALRSHRLAQQAWDDGKLDDEVMTAFVPPYKQALRRDNNVRADSSADKLAKLKPAFDRRYGSVTAANATPLTDGASTLLLMHERRARELGYEPLAFIRSYAFAALDPFEDGLMGPSHATPIALERAGVKLSDMTLVDMHEAFAAQVLANINNWPSATFARDVLGRDEPIGEIDWDRFNVAWRLDRLRPPVRCHRWTDANPAGTRAAAAWWRSGIGYCLRCWRPRRSGRTRGGLNVNEQYFRVVKRDDGVAVISIDVAGESQNIIQVGFIEQANAVLDELERNAQVKGLVFISDKPGSFIAGADIQMLVDCDSATEVAQLARTGQAFCRRVERFAKPAVAAIDGVCLGGGLEFALACGGRVCSDDPATRLGLPEVQLGLLPGSGGTQRLPRLVGIAKALDAMLTGRHLRPDQAKRIGLVDAVVPKTILLDAALLRLQELSGWKPKRLPRWQQWGLKLPPARRLLFNQVRRRTLVRSRGNYPAPERIIDCVETGLAHGFERGLNFEAQQFGELSQTPEARQLMNLYFASNALKKDKLLPSDSNTGADVVAAPVIEKIGVLGAGLMGAGISYVSSARAGASVRLKDQQQDGLSRGMGYINKLVQGRLKRRAISVFEAGRQIGRVTPTLDYSGFAGLNLVIEAVFEDLTLKQQVLADVEAAAGEQVIFASNTSSLRIADIAASSARPSRVLGMHYFSPVEKMPLLEVIATEQTAPEVVAAAAAFGRRQGKTVIVVQDCAGFYVNRILAPYINEAGHLLAEGVALDVIDLALEQYGFPVGPFALLDEIGIDVGSKVGPILHQAFGERMKPVEIAARLVKAGRLGKKTGRGFYRYSGKKAKQVDESVYKMLGVTPRDDVDPQQIGERCILPLLNEAARCLDEQIIRAAADGDIGAVFGIGYPPFRGGPFRHCDAIGISELVAKLEAQRAEHGERFAPAELLTRMAAAGDTFYQ